METLGETSEAQDYFCTIEERFGLLRGRPLLLSPRDVALAGQWHEAGVPLRVVLKALGRFFERESRRERPRKRAPSLEWCERDVYELWEEWKGAHLGDEESGLLAAGGGSTPESPLLKAHLELLLGPLEEAVGKAKAGGRRRVAKALAKLLKRYPEWMGVAEAGDVLRLERELGEAEKAVIQVVERDLTEAELAGLEAEVRSRVEPHRASIGDKAFAVLTRKTRDRALLQVSGLPRIALFSF